MKGIILLIIALGSFSSFAKYDLNLVKGDFLSMVEHRNIDVYDVVVSQGIVGKLVNPLLEVFEAGDPEFLTINFKAKDSNINQYNQYKCTVYVNRSSIIANYDEMTRSCNVDSLGNWNPEN